MRKWLRSGYGEEMTSGVYPRVEEEKAFWKQFDLLATRTPDGEQKPEYYRDYYQRNKERIQANQRAWRERTGYKALRNNYKEMLLSVLKERDGECCGICGESLGDDVTIDHIKLLSHGGGNDAANLRLAHLSCNARRAKRNGSQVDK